MHNEEHWQFLKQMSTIEIKLYVSNKPYWGNNNKLTIEQASEEQSQTL